MDKRKIAFLTVLAMVFVFSGCVVRSYSVQKPRADLDLDSGNRGFLAGKTDAPATVAKTTRETKVVEIEVFPLTKSVRREKSPAKVKPLPQSEEASSSQSEDFFATAVVAAPAQEYKVQENDTLQKISQKFYGTMHKWNKIYEANKDRLRGPDKIKPGQILKIPADSKTQPAPAVRPKDPIK